MKAEGEGLHQVGSDALRQSSQAADTAQVATPAVQANGTLCATARPECRTGNFLRNGESKTTAKIEFEPTDQWERSTSAYHK